MIIYKYLQNNSYEKRIIMVQSTYYLIILN